MFKITSKITKTLKLEIIKVLEHALITVFWNILRIISYPKALLKGMCLAKA